MRRACVGHAAKFTAHLRCGGRGEGHAASKEVCLQLIVDAGERRISAPLASSHVSMIRPSSCFFTPAECSGQWADRTRVYISECSVQWAD